MHYNFKHFHTPRMAKDSEGDSGNSSFTNKPHNKVHEFYITGDIKDASEYIEWYNTIRHASESDVIKVFINSYGGDLFAAIQMVNAIQSTKAKVEMHIEGACLSAATVIFLQGDEFFIHPYSTFMIHNYYGGAFGKGNEMFQQITFERQWSEKLFRDVYKHFLTSDEITTVLNGKDLWMSPEEVENRLKK